MYRLLILLATLIAVQGCKKSVNDSDAEDQTPPATITDLRVSGAGTSSVTLQWTATGDDNNTGIATLFDCRYSPTVINASNFAAATRATNQPIPVASGLTQSLLVDGLASGVTHFFAIKVADEQENWSGVSNCVSAHCAADMVIVFPDTCLDRLMRDRLNLPTGDFHRSSVDTIQDLMFPGEHIKTIAGLEHFFALTRCNLGGNQIEYIIPLQNLTNLTVLDVGGNSIWSAAPLTGLTGLNELLIGGNEFTDLTPLATLQNLRLLNMTDVPASDYTPLAQITALQHLALGSDSLTNLSFLVNLPEISALWIGRGRFSDISPLASLPKLVHLGMTDTPVSDITALSGLVNLMELRMASNRIIDLSPLVINTGIGQGDIVDVCGNPLSQPSINTYIPALQARGVEVLY